MANEGQKGFKSALIVYHQVNEWWWFHLILPFQPFEAKEVA